MLELLGIASTIEVLKVPDLCETNIPIISSNLTETLHNKC